MNDETFDWCSHRPRFSQPWPAVNGGSVTSAGFDKSATIEDMKSSAPQGAKITNTSCETVGVPSGGDNKYRCTVTWE